VRAYNPRVPARALTPFGEFQLKPSHLLTGPGVASPLPSWAAPGPEQVHAARLQACAHATDLQDARDLLDALGIGATA
jgi:hypothetical protein